MVISLRRLDRILERLETFWARCEVDLQLMIQRGDHLKCLTMFAQTPDTVQRLHERLTEYKYFWCRVRDACTRCVLRLSSHMRNQHFTCSKWSLS